MKSLVDQPDYSDIQSLDITGRITFKSKVALGGHSDVWEGTLILEDGITIVPVAIKELRVRHHLGTMPHDEHLRRRFYREVYLWNQLCHPHIVPFLGYSLEANSLPTLVSAWFPKGNIVQYLRANPDANRPQLLFDVCHGLYYLHSIPMVHGDIKADNIMIDANGSASLCDFGLSKFIDDALHITGFTTTTRTGGTARFLCPELLNDLERTPMTDMWAYGCLVIQVLLNQIPYATLRSTAAVQMAIIRGEPPLHPEYDVSTIAGPKFWIQMRKCWNLDPKKRPHAKELLGTIHASFRSQVNPRRFEGKRPTPSRRGSSMSGSGSGSSFFSVPAMMRSPKRSLSTGLAGGKDLMLSLFNVVFPGRKSSGEETTPDVVLTAEPDSISIVDPAESKSQVMYQEPEEMSAATAAPTSSGVLFEPPNTGIMQNPLKKAHRKPDSANRPHVEFDIPDNRPGSNGEGSRAYRRAD